MSHFKKCYYDFPLKVNICKFLLVNIIKWWYLDSWRCGAVWFILQCRLFWNYNHFWCHGSQGDWWVLCRGIYQTIGEGYELHRVRKKGKTRIQAIIGWTFVWKSFVRVAAASAFFQWKLFGRKFGGDLIFLSKFCK